MTKTVADQVIRDLRHDLRDAREKALFWRRSAVLLMAAIVGNAIIVWVTS